MQNERHKRNLNSLKNNSKFSFFVSSSSSTSSTTTDIVQLTNRNKSLTFDDQVSKAEILWALKSVQH
jgi:hypothetical protein